MKAALPNRDMGCACVKEVVAGQSSQIVVTGWVEGMSSNNADPKPQGDIGLDDVGIDRFHDDVGFEPSSCKGCVDCRSTGKA